MPLSSDWSRPKLEDFPLTDCGDATRNRLGERFGGRDDARSDNASVLVVERRGLPRGHPVDRLVEPQAQAARGRARRSPRPSASGRAASRARASRARPRCASRSVDLAAGETAPRAHDELVARSVGAQHVERRRPPRRRGPGAGRACRRRRPRGGPARARPRRGCCRRPAARPRARGSRRAPRRRGSRRPGSRARSRRPGRPRPPRPARRPWWRRPAAVAAAPAPPAARARACTTDPWPRRRRGRRACARRARRAARSGPVATCRAPSRSATPTSAARR